MISTSGYKLGTAIVTRSIICMPTKEFCCVDGFCWFERARSFFFVVFAGAAFCSRFVELEVSGVGRKSLIFDLMFVDRYLFRASSSLVRTKNIVYLWTFPSVFSQSLISTEVSVIVFYLAKFHEK